MAKKSGSSRDLYKLTPGDMAIFQRARRERNPNIFFNYYLRSPASGTWWRPVDPEELDELFVPEFKQAAEMWDSGYKALMSAWMELKKPDFFIEVAPGKYEAIDQEQHDADMASRKYQTRFQLEYDSPVFFHNHGFLYLPWQLEAHSAKQRIRVIIGGYGSGKSWMAQAMQLYYAATLPGFRGFGLAPYSNQARELHRITTDLFTGTLYEERFVVKSNRAHNPAIYVGNDYVVGKPAWRDEADLNGFEFFPILDNTDKILTTTIDMATVDQTEQLPDVSETLRHITTRFRGIERRSGRERLRVINFIANSGESPTMWDLYDEGETDPKRVWSASPGSPDNVFLGIGAMLGYQKDVGSTADERRRHLFGGRPMGDGEHFPKSSLEKCQSDALDEKMRQGQEFEENTGVPVDERQFIRLERPKVAVYRWEIPPEPDRDYYLVADPGWDDPPNRNSAVLAVFDLTGFPAVPASMVAFRWVYGGHSPIPWTTNFVALAEKYNCRHACRYDGTGPQAGYEYMGMGLDEIGAFSVSMGGISKWRYINHLKRLMALGLMQMPSIPHLFSQLARYTYPEPKHLRQDIVSMMLVFASYLIETFALTRARTAPPPGAHERKENRYRRTTKRRNVRRGSTQRSKRR